MSLRRSLRYIFCFPSLVGLMLFGSPAFAGNIMERAIEAAQPCRSLKVDTGFGGIGVDRLESVDVEELLITAAGNSAHAKLIGTLACRTSNKATLRGNVTAKLSFEADFNLETCQISHSDVSILSADGTFGDIVQTFAGTIAKAAKDSLDQQIAKICQ